MKKHIILILMIGFCWACTDNASIDSWNVESEMENFIIKVDNSVDYDEMNLESSPDPSDIYISNNSLIILNTDPKRLNVYHFDGKLIRSYSLDTLEKPELLSLDTEKVYIYDSLLNQVKLFDHEMTELGEISLESFQPDTTLRDMEILDGNIYLSTDGLGHDANIYSYNNEGLQDKIKTDFNGYIAKVNDDLYASNTMELYIDEGLAGAVSGKNELIKMDLEQSLVLAYPNGYMPLDFVVDSNRLFVYNGALNTLDEWGIEHQTYKRSLIQMDFDSDLRAKIALDKDVLFLLMPNQNKLFKIKL